MRIVILFLCLPLFCLSQVGINTTTPEARLEIRSSNQATPSNIDGILIPKIDEYPATNPTAAQDGMLVYATGNGSVTKGFYYWNNTTTSWVPFTGTTIEKIDDLLDGRTVDIGFGSSLFLGENAGENDDGIYNYNIGVGYEVLKENITGGANTAVGFQALLNNISNSNTAIGTWTLLNNTSGSLNTAVGIHSLRYNTTGFGNLALGVLSLNLNETGSFNTAVGYNSGKESVGDYNVFF